MAKASKVPIETNSAIRSMGNNPETAVTIPPTMMVLMCGVRYFLCTLPIKGGSMPSRDMV